MFMRMETVINWTNTITTMGGDVPIEVPRMSSIN
jgi:hypothetical protein